MRATVDYSPVLRLCCAHSALPFTDCRLLQEKWDNNKDVPTGELGKCLTAKEINDKFGPWLNTVPALDNASRTLQVLD